MPDWLCYGFVGRWRRRRRLAARRGRRSSDKNSDNELEMNEVNDWDSEYAVSMQTMGLWGCW